VESAFCIVPVFRLAREETDMGLADCVSVPVSNFNGAKVPEPADHLAVATAARRAAEIILETAFVPESSAMAVLALSSKQRARTSVDLDLDFAPFFRAGLPGQDAWNGEFPAALMKVKSALIQRSVNRLRLHSYAHLSLGLLFGYVFRDRTGFQLEIEQTDKEKGKTIWPSDGEPTAHGITFREFPGTLGSKNLLVKLNLVAEDSLSVPAYTKEAGLVYRGTLEAMPPRYPYFVSGAQALAIARELADKIKSLHGMYGTNEVHLFAAIPLGLAILIGFNLNACGTVQCYEFDNSTRRYYPSCLLT